MTPRKKTVEDVRRAITDDDGRLRYANDTFDLSDAEPIEDPEVRTVTVPVLTANQVVAYNLRRARRFRGMSQEWMGRELGRVTGRTWSKASVSSAEGAFRRSTRPRRFDANELLAFSIVLQVPIPFFFLPPDDAEFADAEFIADVLTEELGILSYSAADLLRAANSPDMAEAQQPHELSFHTPDEVVREIARVLRSHGVIPPDPTGDPE